MGGMGNMDWILHLCAVGTFLALLTAAFRRGSDARLRTTVCSAIMAALAFTPAHWVVHVGMAILLLSSVEFLYRPSHKVWRETLTSFACLAAVTVAGAVNDQFPWVVFPFGVLVALWALTGGPARNRRRRDRELRRRERHDAATEASSRRSTQRDLNRLFNDPRLPQPVRHNLHQLLRRADGLHQELRSRGAGDRLIFEVEQIHEDFAPTAVHGYLALPVETADTQPLQEGKTGATLLDEQITMMHRALDDIAAEARTQGAEGILASYRFLQDKFGRPDDELTL